LLGDKYGAASALSAATGISTGNISEWKSGNKEPGADALSKLAVYFDVSLDYLLMLTDEKKPLTPIVDGAEERLVELFRALPNDLNRGRAIGLLESMVTVLPHSEAKGAKTNNQVVSS